MKAVDNIPARLCDVDVVIECLEVLLFLLLTPKRNFFGISRFNFKMCL